MIKVNGSIIDQNRFPDNTLAMVLDPDTYHIRQPWDNIKWLYDNDSEMFTIMSIVDILHRNGHNNIHLYLPYCPNARMDRIKSVDENFSLKVFTNWLNSLKFTTVHTLNIHSNVSEALIENIHNSLPENDIEIVDRKYRPEVIFFPDEGACKRYSDMRIIKELNLPIAFGIKKRDWKTGKILDLEVINGSEVYGKKVLIIDDICSAGGTFKFSAIKLLELGAKDVALYVSHCENNIQNGDLLKTDLISKIYTTDTILTISDPKIEIINKYRN